MLFYVSYWLLSKMEVVKWNHFVKSKVQDALDSGSALALATAAFLAVYREGFETVLFYKALFVVGHGGRRDAGRRRHPGRVGGAGGVYIAINRFGVRLPLKPFFAVTSAFLYYMAFVFAGKGVAELQEGGLIGTTVALVGAADSRRSASTRPSSRSAPRACWSCSRWWPWCGPSCSSRAGSAA